MPRGRPARWAWIASALLVLLWLFATLFPQTASRWIARAGTAIEVGFGLDVSRGEARRGDS